MTHPGTLEVDVPGSRADRQRLQQQLRSLPAGTTVVLCGKAVGARGRVRRFARAAGIDLLREYVAMPSVGPPTCYVEDRPEALRFFLSRLLTLPRGGTVAAAALGAVKVAAAVTGAGSLLGAAAPTRIALGRAGRARDEASRSSGAAELMNPSGMQSVVLALSKDPNAKLTVLLIPSGGVEPTIAVKVATTEAAESSVAAERRVLLELRARLPEGVLTTIPTIRELDVATTRTALVTTALPGSPMNARYHAWGHLAKPAAVEADFAMAERWLAQLQAATAGPTRRLEIDGGVDDVLARRFGAHQNFRQTMDRLAAIRGRLDLVRTPRTAVHGDFWFGNLLLTGDEISGVVDWEAGDMAGEPLRDLVRFALTYALYLDRHTRPGGVVAGHPGLRVGGWGAGIEYAFDGQAWFPAVFRRFLEHGLARLGADPAAWRDAALTGLVDVAATADHIDFARRHWDLFDRLSVGNLLAG
ncbi:MAG: aminoglycoside phosphotransferase family protein [Candidatus Dormibacteraceae bacterium]